MARISKRDIEEVRARTNIADIASDYVTLKNAGSGSMKGLCPFHDERTPSFHVRPALGYFHCFGCGESGDVYSFLQKIDGVTFQEAVERLAARAGIELTYEDGGGASPDYSKRARLLEANRAAEDFFREQLGSPDAQIGRDFLGGRGFDPQAAERFGVGFAPNSWDALSGHLRSRGFTIEEMREAGLVSTNDRGSSYDRFRGRVIWPIRDTSGQTVGFGARRLLDDDKGPKYLNTPETPVYRKQQVLYGLDLAKRDIARSQQVVVVEGYTDVMAAHLAGVTTAVATCGTAFGVDHIQLIRRIMDDESSAGRVVFTFDPDEAGQKAALRAFSEQQRFSAQTFVATSPDGLDPCDLRLARGDEAVRNLIEDAEPMYEFVIRQHLAGHDLNTLEGRVAALRQTAPVVGGIRDETLRPLYTRRLAKSLGMDLSMVERAVNQSRRASASGERFDDRRAPYPPAGSSAAHPGEAPGQGAGGGLPRVRLRDLPATPVVRLEIETLQAVLQHPGELSPELMDAVLNAEFSDATLATVRDAIVSARDVQGTASWIARISEEMPEMFAGVVPELAVASIPAGPTPQQVGEYVRSVAKSLVERDLLRRRAQAFSALQRAEAERDDERMRELQREIADLEAQKRAIRGE